MPQRVEADGKRGAKVAMAVAIQSPQLVHSLIPVDNAPVDAHLSSDFPRYVRAMREIEDAKVSRQAQADVILKPYESVRSLMAVSQWTLQTQEKRD